MSVIEVTGDLLKSNSHALVNTVNCVGVMGKGIALAFKRTFPDNFKQYRKACEQHHVKVGKMFVTSENNQIIINFPTKEHWCNPSQLQWIEYGLDDLIKVIRHFKIRSVSLPRLGCSNGGLSWSVVRPLIYEKLNNIDCEITIYSLK